MVALVADATEDCLPLGLLGLRPFGGMVPSGKELTRSRMAILNPFNSLLRSSASFSMRPRPSLQTPRWQGRAAAIDRRPWRRPLCASWLSLSKSSLTAFSVADRQVPSQNKKSESRSRRAPGSASSFYHQPYQCRPSHCDCHVYITRHAIEWPQRYLRTLDAFVY